MTQRGDGILCDHSHDDPVRRAGKCPRCGYRGILLNCANSMHNAAMCERCHWAGCQCEILGRVIKDVPNEAGWLLREVYGYKGHIDYVCARDPQDDSKSHMEWYRAEDPPDVQELRDLATDKAKIPRGRFAGQTYSQVRRNG